MVAKLKAMKAELQRRKHHRTTEVGAWIRKAVLGYYQYHAAPGNSTQLRIFRRRVGWLWRSVLVRRSQRAQVRWDRLYPLLHRWIPRPRLNGSALRFLWMRSVRPYYYYVTENFPNHGPPLRAGTSFHACTPELAANMVPSCGK
jgi:hypothetical protein